jgi:GNAT superfamily N-acetyltransferase
MMTAMRVDIPEDRPRVEVALSDGSVAVLSPLVPEDRQYLVEGLGELSLESRFTRFGQGRHGLSGQEWSYLTDIDQHSHVAWVAAIDDEGAGVGRYVRFADDECAEVAVTVLDEFQGRGLGTEIFLALIAVGRADGVESFCFEVVPSNSRMLEVLRRLSAEIEENEGLVQGRLLLSADIDVPLEKELVRVFNQVREAG